MDDVLDQCNGSTCNKSCDYMNLWLYDQAMRITNENFFINSFYQALNLLGGSSKSRKNQCSIKNFQLNQEELNKKQILYEFLHIYDGIKNKLQSQEDDSKIKLYCKHILENFGFYHENKESCTSTELCKYYDELTDFKSKFSNPAELTYIYQKCKYEETTCKNGSNAEDDVPCLREEENSFLYLIFGNDPEDIIKVLLNVTIISVPILAFFVILFKYFNYTCYHKLRDYYHKSAKTESCIKFLEKYTVPSVVRTIEVSSYKPLIDELVNRLSSNGLNYYIHSSITCKYINYWLNEEIKDKYSMLFGFNFNIFKECADEYAKFKNGLTVYKENSCGEYLNSIHDDKYTKMNSLYKLYFWYKQIELPPHGNYEDKLCDTLDVISFHYRQMINEFKGDRDLCSKLNEFKKLVINNKTLFKNRCNIDISDKMPTPTMFLPKVETPEREKENISLPDTLITSQSNELQHSADETRQNLGSQLTEGPVSHPVPSPVVGSQTNEFREAVSGTEQLGAAGSRREQAYTLRPQETAVDSTALQYSVYPEVGSELKMERGVPRDPENNIFEERNNNIHGNMISLDTGGFSGAIKDAFSNIVQNVEPGPVLGVSGGMGVLFLLFKVLKFL
ncbi:hypothetical protein PVMG_05818 [Plasmodium vivax Mauritania I]|uniref:Uncharacterized protein n=1 Tax=Plasmodium vivax Mauritania I TaxID=1035515 RepID=A0A0J9TK84_PLAVI|nr:hypothetical protein PVMG_05818 [Plasmodium vivax Mauritania I]